MPKKISLEEKRGWLKQYEKRKSEISIARNASCDTKTVKKGIEDARLERDGNKARAELIRDVLRSHHDSLLVIMRHVRSALAPLEAAAILVLWDWKGNNEISITLSGSTAKIPGAVSVAEISLVLDAEKGSAWSLLHEHLRYDFFLHKIFCCLPLIGRGSRGIGYHLQLSLRGA